ncbi:TPA: hypothetical protein U2D04_000787 [Streptococcus suis]|nr:hypothetical protein [Streptococcus suis]HEM6398069.1 hypothetical protein [Streptococcus suis]HEM6399642.1 hypothetical protein [Streptococcus suis]
MRVIIHYPKPIKQVSSQRLPLLVDGKIAGTVTQGKILSLPITQPSVTLGVRGDKKSAIPVKQNDRIQIKENANYFILHYFSLAIIPLVLLFDLPALVKIILSILALAITLSGQAIFPKYIISTEKSSDH